MSLSLLLDFYYTSLNHSSSQSPPSLLLLLTAPGNFFCVCVFSFNVGGLCVYVCMYVCLTSQNIEGKIKFAVGEHI